MLTDPSRNWMRDWPISAEMFPVFRLEMCWKGIETTGKNIPRCVSFMTHLPASPSLPQPPPCPPCVGYRLAASIDHQLSLKKKGKKMSKKDKSDWNDTDAQWNVVEPAGRMRAGCHSQKSKAEEEKNNLATRHRILLQHEPLKPFHSPPPPPQIPARKRER